MCALYVELNLLTGKILYSTSYIGIYLSSTGNIMLLLIIKLIIIINYKTHLWHSSTTIFISTNSLSTTYFY